MPVSGPQWCSQFPTSNKVADLEPGFRAKVTSFLNALAAAKASVQITATLRPPQRAYLMHYAWRIAKQNLDPASIPAFVPKPPMAPIDIQWLHKNPAGAPDFPASKAAAVQMVAAYDIATLGVAPALASLHIAGQAIDMNISWAGPITIKDAKGVSTSITTTPRDGTNTNLIKVGASYGVIHLIDVLKDKPHWSINGH